MPKLLEILAIIDLDYAGFLVIIYNPNSADGPKELMQCSYDEYTKIAQMYEFVGYKIEKATFEENTIRVLYKLEV